MSKSPIKVAVIIDTWFPIIGGGQINVFEISKRLCNKNCQIDVITRNCGKDSLKLPPNLRVIKLGTVQKPYSFFSKFFFILKSFNLLLKSDYDLIHAHAFLSGITARLLLIIKKTPAIFTVHGTSIGTNLNNKIEEKIERFILTQIRYSAQITVSQDFLRLTNLNKKIFYIPNGVDVNIFDKVPQKKSTKTAILFVGRLHKQKNLKTLIESFAKISSEFPNLDLNIVGSGPQKKELQAQTKKSNFKKINFIGSLSGKNLIKRYKESLFLTLPSFYEGLPLSLLEAWAAKIPVVVTKTGDCQFIVKNGNNGFLINNPNLDELTKTLKIALRSNLTKIGLNGYNLVKKKFSWDYSAAETLKVYEQLTKI